MSGVEKLHPGDEQLLRYADGELAPGGEREVRSHVDSCHQCRLELEAIRRAGTDFAGYHRACFPAPPEPWDDIRVRLAQADAPGGRGRAWFPLSVWRWAPAALALALAAMVVVYQLRNTPSVRADEVLRKAVAAAEKQPKPRRVQVRTRIRKFEELKPLFHAAHYSWDDPLSARSFQQWRGQLARKRDDVTRTADSCYRVRTSADSGELAEAALKLRISDLRPVENVLQFRNQEWVHITELPEIAPEAARTSAGPVPVSPVAPAPAAPASETPVTPGEELRVFAALHQMGADLGEPVDVTRTDGEIVVTGMGLDSERRQQIQNALAAMPRVVLRFPGTEAEVPAADEQEAAARPEASRLETQLEEYLGGGVSFAQFSEQVLNLNEGLMARAHALRRLAQRFPPEIESGLGEQDRSMLRDMRADHAEVLRRQAAELERALAPALAALGARPHSPSAAALGGTWQSATEELFQAAREFDRLLGMLLGGAGGNVSSQDLPEQIQSRLAQLAARAVAYSETKEPVR
jgi:Putative zinc-finger